MIRATRASCVVLGAVLLLLTRTVAGHPSGGTESTGAAAPMLRVDMVDSIGMTVSDIDRSVAFYTNVLTFEKVGDRSCRAVHSRSRAASLARVRDG